MSRHAIACNSGTTAVELGLRALNASPTTTVIAPALAPVMTALPVLQVGSTIVLYDCCSDSVYPDMEYLARIDAPPGSILVTVAWWGYLCPDGRVLRTLCDRRGWRWLDDSAQAHGASYAASSDAQGPDIRCFSTHDRKLVTTGEGGFLLTHDEEWARKARSYASYGGYPSSADDLMLGSETGANLRLSALAAAMGIVSLRSLPDVIARRQRASATISAHHGELKRLIRHPTVPGALHNFYGITFTLPDSLGRHFGARYLDERGIQNDVVDYDLRPLYEYPVFRQAQVHRSENAQRLARSLVMISPHHGLSEDACAFIGQTLRSLEEEADAKLSGIA